MAGRSHGMSTLLIGLDAARAPVIDRLGEDGVVPNLAELCEAGVSGPIESPDPSRPSTAWPSMYTGTNPGKHGVFGVTGFAGYDWSVVEASDVRERPIWERLDHYGLASVVVNVPVTHRPRPFEGALIPGPPAPDDPPCHPAGLLGDVRAEIGDYRSSPGDDGVDPEAYRERVHTRGRAFRYLADQFAPDFGWLGFQVADAVAHGREVDGDVVSDVYGAVDEEIGTTVDACDPDNVFVVGPHGVGECDGYTVDVNEILRSAGFVESTRRGPDVPGQASIYDTQPTDGSVPEGPDHAWSTRLRSRLSTSGVGAQWIAGAIETTGLDGIVRRLSPSYRLGTGGEHVDLATSRAYMRSPAEWGVRINLEGREPDGVVPREEYFAVRDELVSVLSSVRTPEGDPVFSVVAPREDYYEGSATDAAVDVVTVPNSRGHVLSTGLSGAVFDEPSAPLTHVPGGFVAAAGTAIDPDAGLGDAHIFDVAPTVLATFDVPADVRMDGSTLPLVGSSGERAFSRVRRRARPLPSTADEGRRRSDLGSLERDW